MRSKIIAALLIAFCPAIAMAQSLEGVWRVDEFVVGGGEDEGRHTTDIQPGLYFFTRSHYSRMFIRAWEPRALLGEPPTDEERLAAYTPFIANAGRYEVEGSTITFVPSVAKSPNRMAPDPIVQELEWDGESFWLIYDSNAGDWKDRAHYVRVEE